MEKERTILEALQAKYGDALVDPELDDEMLSGSILLDARDNTSGADAIALIKRLCAEAEFEMYGFTPDPRGVWLEFWIQFD